MDTITHTLFGLALYTAVNREKLDKPSRRALLFTCIGASNIPDIDVISQWWDTQGQYQMWHRGITHSLFVVPIWSLLFAWLGRLIWKARPLYIAAIAALAVLIHITSDLCNTWGTGILEPFNSRRFSLGVIPIIDLTIWSLIVLGFAAVYLLRRSSYRTFRWVWALIALHAAMQSAQGFAVYQEASTRYEQVALAATFVPAQFNVIGKNGEKVDILETSLWTETKTLKTLQSDDHADLSFLFAHNPRAETLYRWSPFVVIVDNPSQIALFDPRFYRNGRSFLYEAADKP